VLLGAMASLAMARSPGLGRTPELPDAGLRQTALGPTLPPVESTPFVGPRERNRRRGRVCLHSFTQQLPRFGHAPVSGLEFAGSTPRSVRMLRRPTSLLLPGAVLSSDRALST
jgi:hypothetical protein